MYNMLDGISLNTIKAPEIRFCKINFIHGAGIIVPVRQRVVPVLKPRIKRK